MSDQNETDTSEQGTPSEVSGTTPREKVTRRSRIRHMPSIGFGQAISLAFKNYFKFSGRATRPEFWFFALFNLIINILVSFTESTIQTGGLLEVVVGIALFFPGLTLAFRRLHDVDKSGLWLLMYFVPLVVWILAFVIGSSMLAAVAAIASLAIVIRILIWNCTKGTRGENKYGPPRGETL